MSHAHTRHVATRRFDCTGARLHERGALKSMRTAPEIPSRWINLHPS